MWVRQREWIDPVEAASRLAGLPSLALLDSAMAHPTLGRHSYLAVAPFAVFHVRNGIAYWDHVAESCAPLAALRRRLQSFPIDKHPGLPPFQGGAIGYVGYEFGWSLEGRHPPHPGRGHDLHLAFHDTVIAFDHVARRCWLIASGHPAPTQDGRRRRAEARLGELETQLANAPSLADAEAPPVAWDEGLPRKAYRERVERVKAFIRDGDIYQANIAQHFAAPLPADADPWAIYRHLREKNPAPFAAYLDCGGRKVLSTSPESFLRSDGRLVETRPIKGTARRATDPHADSLVAAALLASRKDQAENVMIVDLLRNDLAKVCGPASVDVPMLCGLESYAGLHHLVSIVTGELAPNRDVLDLLAATFPGGSITGAPKIRAMEIIAELEGLARNVYCGAIGSFGFDGSLDLNIAIRTVTVEDGQMELHAGGGITMLSDPDAEYEETLTKARRILSAFAAGPVKAEATA